MDSLVVCGASCAFNERYYYLSIDANNEWTKAAYSFNKLIIYERKVIFSKFNKIDLIIHWKMD